MDPTTSRFVELACKLPDEVWTDLEALRFLWRFDPLALAGAERVYVTDVLRALPERNLHLVCLVSPNSAHLVEREVLNWAFYTDFLRSIRDGDLSSSLDVAYQQAVLAALRLSTDEWRKRIREMLKTDRPAGAIASPLIKIGPLIGSLPSYREKPRPREAPETAERREDWVSLMAA